MKDSNIIGILLAAGQSKRMGQAKQLLDISGEPLVVHTAKKLLAIHSDFELLTILGAKFEIIQPALAHLATNIIFNPHFQRGMGTSLVAALQYIDNQQLQPTALLLSVCDQPYLTTDLLQLLIKTHHRFPTKIIAARYQSGFGVPAILPQRFFTELRQLQADKGARKIMYQYPDEMIFVDFPQGNIDLDTPTDYQTFISKNS